MDGRVSGEKCRDTTTRGSRLSQSARQVAQCPNTTHEALLFHALKLVGPRVVPFLIRTAQDFASDRQPLPLDWLQLLIRTGQADDPALLAQIEGAMPKETLVLREKAAEVGQLLIGRLKRLPGDSEQTRIELARLSNNFGVRLSALGRREEALAQAQEAVRICRQLEQARPDAFLPDLAGSLNNLAIMLSALGRREEALAQGQEAVRIRRQLAQARPDAFLPKLALSLNNLATMLSDLGRREEALAQGQEAVRIRRQLAQARPDAFLPDLAGSLNNLVNMLSDLGRREEALAQAQEAVRLHRQLAQARPDAFLPDLARSLAVQGTCFTALERYLDAVPVFTEAIRLLTPLFTQLPGALAPLMGAIRQDYLAASQAAKQQPDAELLAPLVEVFACLQKSPTKK
jgi:tetratricopeptide (TPR) repeat protein